MGRKNGKKKTLVRLAHSATSSSAYRDLLFVFWLILKQLAAVGKSKEQFSVTEKKKIY